MPPLIIKWVQAGASSQHALLDQPLAAVLDLIRKAAVSFFGWNMKEVVLPSSELQVGDANSAAEVFCVLSQA